jgi:hypothetical protein
MRFEKTSVYGFKYAIKEMHIQNESPIESDSKWKGFCTEDNDWVDEDCSDACLKSCENDFNLMQRLILAGPEHRQFLRRILVTVDITAPLYWWKEKEFEVGMTVKNTDTKQKFETPITKDCFEMNDFRNLKYGDGDWTYYTDFFWDSVVEHLEALRKMYLDTKEDRYFNELKRLLPQSWLETRTVTLDYGTILTMIQNNEPSIIEWAKTLPYSEKLLFLNEPKKEEFRPRTLADADRYLFG